MPLTSGKTPQKCHDPRPTSRHIKLLRSLLCNLKGCFWCLWSSHSVAYGSPKEDDYFSWLWYCRSSNSCLSSRKVLLWILCTSKLWFYDSNVYFTIVHDLDSNATCSAWTCIPANEWKKHVHTLIKHYVGDKTPRICTETRWYKTWA